MSVAVDRYGVITREFQFQEAYNATIDTRYAKARELEIESNLDSSLTSSLLTQMFGVIGAVRRRFVVELKGTTDFSVDDFAGQVPVRYFTASEFDITNLPCIVTRLVVDEDADTTTMELWG
jgi:hypothetical protein